MIWILTFLGFGAIIIVMNKKEEQFWKLQISESVSNLYWDFRDSLEDKGGEELNKECKKLEKKILEIVKGYDVSV